MELSFIEKAKYDGTEGRRWYITLLRHFYNFLY